MAFDINSTILLGSDLRVLLNSDHISYGEVHAILKDKGIYIGASDKSFTVPLLSSTLLTPDNFSKLINSSVNRELTPKIKVSSVSLVSEDCDWMTPLKNSLFNDDQLFLDENKSIEFIDTPTLIVNNKDKITIPYKISRKDYSKDWIQRELEFTGEITLEKQGNKLKLDLSSTHSSKETESINRIITKKISKVLKDENITKSDKPNEIKFGDFSNEERVRFFKRLTAGFSKILTIGNVNDIEISRDLSAGNLPIDPRIEWMNQTVSKVKIDGERLNDIFLISEESFYKYYNILRMDVSYKFTTGANSGDCRISFSFSSISKVESKKNEAELIFEPTKIQNSNTVNTESKKIILLAITNAVRSLIESKYEQMFLERTTDIAPSNS